MDAVKFLKEKERICNIYSSCTGCPLGTKKNGVGCDCADLSECHPEKCVEIVEKWSAEYPKPILTDEEKEYLSNVIKPFKDRVTSIIKYVERTKFAYITITLRTISSAIEMTFDNLDYIEFPLFETETLYMNMEDRKSYTLKELGLQEIQAEQADNQNRCVCCGKPIPEGQQVCYLCKKESD